MLKAKMEEEVNQILYPYGAELVMHILKLKLDLYITNDVLWHLFIRLLTLESNTARAAKKLFGYTIARFLVLELRVGSKPCLIGMYSDELKRYDYLPPT